MTDWREFGDEIARSEDLILEKRNALLRARTSFLEQASALVQNGSLVRHTRVRTLSFAMAAAAVVVIAVAFFAFLKLGKDDASLDAVVSGSNHLLRGGEWIASPSGESRRIDFSDGSSIALSPNSDARVVTLEANGAHVFLERGTAHASVHKRSGAHWQVDVGPYTVSVKGTRFTVAWEPTRQQFTLSLEEGSVFVRGPLLQDGRMVAVSETLRAFVAEGRLEITANGDAPTAGDDLDKEPFTSASAHDDANESRSFEASSPPQCVSETFAGSRMSPRAPHERIAKDRSDARTQGGSAPENNDWRSLAKAGRHAAALASAEAQGLDAVLGEASASDLVLLGDSARLGRSYAVANRCYRAVREKFPGGRDAANAAFALGKLDFDHRHLYAQAAEWMSVYLAESDSNAVLAREALGRLIEAAQKAGEFDRAKKAAARYLSSYPDGPHADLARSIAKSDKEDPTHFAP